MPQAIGQEKLDVTKLQAMIRRSGLLEADQLTAALDGINVDESSADDLLQWLVDKECLTLWQSQQLRKGRYKGFLLGKYRLLGKLGRGGMATVYLAQHRMLGSHAAIKVLSRERIDNASMRERFLREARAAAQITHPNIVRVFDVDTDGDRHYLVMEYVRGWSLQDLVDTEGVLSYRKAAEYTRQAAQGLAHAHAGGLVHRDIKPANLLVEDGTTVKVSDFGLARVDVGDEDASLTMQHEEKVLGTADYIAPEQAVNSHRIDARADQYSLGCSLYFLLTGQAPFPDGRIVERLTKHCTVEPEAVTKFRPDAPPGLLAILHRLTRKKPDQRYASMNEVAAALERCLDEQRHDSTGSLPAMNAGPSAAAMMSSASQDDDLLGLAPDEKEEVLGLAPDEEAAAVSPTKPATGKSNPPDELSIVDSDPELEPVQESGELAELPRDALMQDDEDDDDEVITLSESEDGSISEVIDPSEDVHISDELDSPQPAGASRDTNASREAQATSASSDRIAVPQPKVGFWKRMYEGMKRGEYPLWVLIGAGLLLGGLLLFVAWSYSTSFEPEVIPMKNMEGQ